MSGGIEMTLYQKVIAVFSTLRSAINGKADNSEIAPEFSDSREYAPGDSVIYNDALYRCTAPHSGTWDGQHFSREPLSEIIPKRMSDLENDIGYVDAENIQAKFGDMELADDATQADIRRAVKAMISAMKSLANTTSALAACALLPISAIGAMPDDSTNWEDVGPTNKVKDVVVKFTPAPDFSPGNTQLVNTIRSESMTTNSQSFLVGLMNNMATSVYDSGTIVLKDHEINCVTRPYNVSFELPPQVPGRSCSFGVFIAHSPENTFTFPTNGVTYISPNMDWPFRPPEGNYLRYSFAMFYEIYCPDIEIRSFVLLGGECFATPVSEGQGR